MKTFTFELDNELASGILKLLSSLRWRSFLCLRIKGLDVSDNKRGCKDDKKTSNNCYFGKTFKRLKVLPKTLYSIPSILTRLNTNYSWLNTNYPWHYFIVKENKEIVNRRVDHAFHGGPERIRTADLRNANAAHYQLCYRPSLYITIITFIKVIIY